MGVWYCYICGKRKKDLSLIPCEYHPRHLVSFKVDPMHILTTVCSSCLKGKLEKQEIPHTKKIRIPIARPKYIPLVHDIPHPTSGKTYCLGCLYLPDNLLCGIKKGGKYSEISIVSPACHEYKEKVF